MLKQEWAEFSIQVPNTRSSNEPLSLEAQPDLNAITSSKHPKQNKLFFWFLMMVCERKEASVALSSGFSLTVAQDCPLWFKLGFSFMRAN